MRVGLKSPTGEVNPGSGNPWAHDDDVDELSLVAEVADALGFNHLTLPAESASNGLLDPGVVLGYLAARTQQLRYVLSVQDGRGTEAVCQTQHTLARVLRGRFVAATTVKGARAVPGGAWWITGADSASFRHALEVADGWQLVGQPDSDLSRALAGWCRTPGFEVVLETEWLDPIGEPEQARHAIRQAWALGASLCTVRLGSVSADHHCEQLGALRELLTVDGEI